jgi:hypothetical protein
MIDVRPSGVLLDETKSVCSNYSRHGNVQVTASRPDVDDHRLFDVEGIEACGSEIV